MYISRVIASGYARFGLVDITPPRRGVVALVGRNGSCKSSWGEIVGFAIFGRTPRGAEGADVANETLPDETRAAHVRVEFAGDDGKLVGFIDRHVAPKPRGGTETELTWTIYGASTRGDTPTDRQTQLLTDLRLDWKAWRTAVHFTPDFGFFRIDDGEKREVVDALTGQWRYAAARDALKADLAAAEARLQVATAQLNALRQQRRSDASYLSGGLHAAVLAAASAAVTAGDPAVEVEALKQQAIGAQQRVTTLTHEYAEIETRHREAKEMLAFQEERAGADPTWRLNDFQTRLASARAAARDAATKLEAARTGVCSQCERPGIAPTRVTYLEQCWEMAGGEAQGLADAAAAAEGAVTAWRAAQPPIDRLRALINTLYQMGLQKLAEKNSATAICEAAQRMAAERHRSGTTPAPTGRPDIAPLLTRLRENLHAQVPWATEIVALRRKAVALRFWVDTGYSNRGVKAQLLARWLPMINEELVETTHALSDGRRAIAISPVSISEKGDVKEKLTPIVSNAEGSSTLVFNSSGEKKVYDLAAIGAFSEVARRRAKTRLDFLFLNEVFEHIDDQTLGRVAAFLRRLAVDRQVFVEAHQVALIDQIEERILFEKVDGVARATPQFVTSA